MQQGRRAPARFPIDLARGLRARGITPFIWWQPTDPANPAAGVYERYQNIIKGKHDQYIRDWAKAAKAYGKPVIVRFAHEMNGDWFPWSMTSNGNTPERFVKAWRHIVIEFRSVGARNVKFLWSPYNSSRGGYADVLPGQRLRRLRRRHEPELGQRALACPAGPPAAAHDRPAQRQPDAAATRRASRSSCPRSGPTTSAATRPAGSRSGYTHAYKKWPTIRAMVYFDYNTAAITVGPA